MKSKADDNQMTEVQRHEDRLKELNDNIKVAQNKLGEIKQQLSDAEKQLTSKKAEYKSLDKSVKHEEDRLSAERADVARLFAVLEQEKKLHALEHDKSLASIKEMKKVAEKLKAEAQDEKDKLTKELNNLASSKLEISKSLENAKDYEVKMQAAKVEAEASRAEAKEKLFQAKKAKEEADALIKQCESRMEALKASEAAMVERCVKFDEANKHLLKSQEVLDDKLRELAIDEDEIAKARVQLEKEIKLADIAEAKKKSVRSLVA